MRTVADIMSRSVITLTVQQTMKDAHALFENQGVRHLPVMDEDGKSMLGLVTQKAMIARVIKIISEHGSENLIEQEMKTPVTEIALKDFGSVKLHQPLLEVSRYFLDNKYGCLVVFDEEDNLVGILSSSDFVRLSANLLATEG